MKRHKKTEIMRERDTPRKGQGKREILVDMGRKRRDKRSGRNTGKAGRSMAGKKGKGLEAWGGVQ